MATKTFKIGLSNTDKQNMAQDVYERVLALTFAEYDSANTYNKGDFVVYDDTLYQCKQDNTTGTWDSSKWQQATLQDLLDDIEGAVAFVNDKANVDGNYPTMTVGAADNLTPYDEDSGTDQEQPFLLQGTGCGNGEQQVDTGALGLLKEKQGNTVVVNNQIQDNFGTGTGWTASNVTVTFSDNQAHIVGTGNSNGSIYKSGNPKVSGHKYLIIFEAKASVNSNFGYGFAATYKTLVFSATTSWGIFFDLITTSSDNIYEYIYYEPTGETLDVKNFIAIDLTQWFGSNDNIPAHLLSHPEDFFRYYQGSLAYNTGELVNANSRYIKCIGRNQWDEVFGMTPEEADGSVNKIKVIPNATYYLYFPADRCNLYIYGYDKDGNKVQLGDNEDYIRYSSRETFTAPSNCVAIRFVVSSGYGNSYQHDITISIYYDGESGYDQYYPYEELANIDTGTETLRSAGSVKDTKAPDGTITRRVGSYTFTGSESWSHSVNGYYIALPLAKSPVNDDTKAKAVCEVLECFDVNSINAGTYTNGFGIAVGGYLFIGSDTYTNRANLVGKSIFYELAAPTTEQGTTFSENVAIDDFGSMDFAGNNGVPQGASIFYAVDYKSFIDSLYNTLDGDATDIVKESELDTKLAALGYVKLTSVSGYDATKTQVLKNVEGTLTWVTEE